MTPSELINIIVSLIGENEMLIDENTNLISSGIDSMNLVQICLALEEKSNDEGFDFDWTSEKAMSSMNSILKTPRSLTEEYNRQKSKVKNS